MKYPVYLLQLALLWSVLSLPAQGQDHHNHDHDSHSESHDAHVHGIAELTLALEENALAMEFVSPSANIVGFEHKAKSNREKQLVSQAKTFLESPRILFAFEGTECKLQTANVAMSGLTEADDREHEEHDRDGHSDVTASYKYTCQNPKKLTSVSVTLFRKFPGIEKINAMWVTGSSQGAKILSEKKTAVQLR